MFREFPPQEKSQAQGTLYLLPLSTALSCSISRCPCRVLSCTVNIIGALGTPGGTAGSQSNAGYFTKEAVTDQKKMRRFHSPVLLVCPVSCCLPKDREALMNFFIFILTLLSSNSHSLSRLCVLSWWHTGSCLGWAGQAVLCGYIQQPEQEQSGTHTRQLPAKRETAGTITAVKDTTTTECPGVAAGLATLLILAG